METWKRIAKTVFLSVILAVFLIGGLIEKGNGQQVEKPIKLTYALFMPGTSVISKKNMEYAQEIEKRTNGRVQITVQHSGSLLVGPAMFQGIRSGIADMGHGMTTYNPGNFPFTQIAELPSASESGWVISNVFYDFLEKYQPKEWNDVHMLTPTGSGFGSTVIATGKVQIRTLEDLKGRSFRTNFVDVTTALGATVKDVPMAEVFDAISKGVIDGIHTSSEPLKNWRLADAAKYVTLFFGPVMPANVIYNIMNKNKWNSLPSDIQKIITDVSFEYNRKFGLTWDEQLVQGIEYSKSVGNTIYVLPKEEASRWTAAIKPVVDACLKSVVGKGFTQTEVEEAWAYFKSRVAYWNGQQAKNNVSPVQAQMEVVLKK
jgi:TRAP-type C4-dicarboxylate transport system substrate-binding protein